MRNQEVAKCYDCGLEYSGEAWIEAVIPDKIWNRIKPENCADGAGLLCITCISRRLVRAGIKNVPVWLCGIEPLSARQGNMLVGSPEELILRNWDKSNV